MQCEVTELTTHALDLLSLVGNGSIPCSNCLDRSEECVVTPKRRQRSKINQSYDPVQLSRRVEQIENLLLESTESAKSQHRSEHLAIRQRHIPSRPSGLATFSPVPQEYDDQRTNEVTYLASVSFIVDTFWASLGQISACLSNV